jgi:hypothetical protein
MKKNLLIAAVMLLALSTAAMAQFVPGARFTVASVPETFVSCCGQTERTGDIGWTAVPGSPDSITGTITVTYPVFITNGIGSGYGTGIWAEATATTASGTTGTAPTVSIASVTNDPVTGRGAVVINVGAGGIYPYTISLSGVRVNVSGSCSGSISANITSTGNLLTSGETNVMVISNVAQALQTPTASGAIAINAVTGDEDSNPNNGVQKSGTVTFRVRENFPDAFGKTQITDLSANTSKMIRLAVSKVPAGVTLSFPVTGNNNLFQLSSSNGTLATAAQVVSGTSTVPAYVYYRLVTDSSPIALEYLDIPITVANSGPYPLTGAPVTISAHVAPIDATNTMIPRYADLVECETSATQVVSIYGASTTLLVPYAVNMSGLLGYNTGIAVANTTTDPGTGFMGFTTAVKQSGAITFYFYPQTGPTFTYATTAGSPGSGLNSDGTLKTGGTYVVLLDQLLTAAGQSLDFTGYIFIITNFTNAHGQYFISNFEEFTNGALMLVVNNSDTIAGRAGPEKLDN